MCYSCTLRLVVWDKRCHLAIFFFALSYKWFLLLLWRMSNKKGDMTTSWRRWTQTTSRQAAVWQITILQKKSLWAVQFAVKLNIKEREWHSVYFKQPYTATLPSSILTGNVLWNFQCVWAFTQLPEHPLDQGEQPQTCMRQPNWYHTCTKPQIISCYMIDVWQKRSNHTKISK